MGGRESLFEVMSMLPNDLCEHLDSPDNDSSGSLTVDELYPVVASLAGTREWLVTDEQCARFAKIFDEDGNGTISKAEFVAFVQFTLAMLYCNKAKEDAARRATASSLDTRAEAPIPPPYVDQQKRSPTAEAPAPSTV